MARANVRISTAKVLDLLRTKAKETAKQLAELPAAEKKYEAAIEAWRKKVVASIGKTTKPHEVSVVTSTYGEYRDHIKVELTYLVPKSKVAERPERLLGNEYALKNNLSELEQTIKLLELTEDDTVSATAYRNLAELL